MTSAPDIKGIERDFPVNRGKTGNVPILILR